MKTESKGPGPPSPWRRPEQPWNRELQRGQFNSADDDLGSAQTPKKGPKLLTIEGVESFVLISSPTEAWKPSHQNDLRGNEGRDLLGKADVIAKKAGVLGRGRVKLCVARGLNVVHPAN